MDERTLNDLLECSVCLERLDTSSKVLPCQHTFCRKCLEVIVSSHQELRCPECRVLVDCKIDELPPNVLLMRILEGMKNASYNQQNSTKTPRNAINIHSTGLNNQINANNQKLITNQANRNAEDYHVSRNIISPKYHSLTSVPHAKALYDFTSKESGDLAFHKGDVIILRKRIDQNWFVGESNGREGAFPINHVQIIVPLPIPQCKALYDFRMGPNEEEGCLTFKKGTIINVMRRVDQNWAEGRIAECIGIFPIAFVEMNSLAKQLMEISAKNLQLGNSSRIVPPTPFETNSSDSSSTITTSPNSSSTSNTSSNSSTAPSSPTSNLNNPTPQQQQPIVKPRDMKDKRHSLTALLGNNSGGNVQINRHSAEILSNPSEPENSTIHETAGVNQTSRHRSEMSHHHKNNTKIANHIPIPNLPAAYVALFPYKPQKSDELELKKGYVYYVIERCQDGWFKGTNRSQKSGVFPGNYVALLRNRENNAPPNSSRSAQNHLMNHHQQQQQQQHAVNLHQPGTAPLAPPALPPRSNTSASSVWAKSGHSYVESFFNRKHVGSSQSKNDKSVGNSCQAKNGEPSSASQTTQLPTTSNKDKKESSSSAVSLMKRLTNIKRSKSPTSNSPHSYSMDNPVFEDSVTSTTPSSSTVIKPTLHMSHPVHVRSGSCPSQLLQSLPLDINNSSNSIGNGTAASNNVNAENTTDVQFLFGSQRIKGHKERPSLQGMRHNGSEQQQVNRLRGIPDGGNVSANTVSTASTTAIATGLNVAGKSLSSSSATNNSVNAVTSYHRKSQSLDAATISSQIAGNAVKNKPQHVHVRERFRCIVSYPPNSEYELELHVGDIVYVHKKRDNGWYKGTHHRTGKVGLFPASFVEPDI